MATQHTFSDLGSAFAHSRCEYLRINRGNFYATRQDILCLVIASVPGVTDMSIEDITLFSRGPACESILLF